MADDHARELPVIANHVIREGNGIPLVLVHGFPVDSRMWGRCAMALMELSDADELVQYPIWRGYAGCGRESGADCGTERA